MSVAPNNTDTPKGENANNTIAHVVPYSPNIRSSVPIPASPTLVTSAARRVTVSPYRNNGHGHGHRHRHRHRHRHDGILGGRPSLGGGERSLSHGTGLHGGRTPSSLLGRNNTPMPLSSRSLGSSPATPKGVMSPILTAALGSSTSPSQTVPGLPFLPSASSSNNDDGPPARDSKRIVVEAAVHAERYRAKELEKQEKHMDEAGLRVALKRERAHSAKIAADLAALRAAAVTSQAEAEICEEGRINHLMRRLECLHLEKGRIIVELEREEEMLTNTLQKKLNEVRREKAQLEQVIAQEQMAHLDLKQKLNKKASQKSVSHGQQLTAAAEDEEEENSEPDDFIIEDLAAAAAEVEEEEKGKL